jgi:hypothetical protein
LTSFGLALLAGRGLDRSLAKRQFWMGFNVALAVGALAWCWSFYWTSGADYRASALAPTRVLRFGAAGATWLLAIVAIVAWRTARLGSWAPVGLASLELSALLFVGPIVWGRMDEPLETSPVLARLAKLSDAGLVAGRLQDLPTLAGRATAFPYLGITPPPPNYMLEAATRTPGQNDLVEKRWLRRLGVTHGVWGSADFVFGTDVIARIPDPVLDLLMATVPASRESGLSPWTLVRVPGTFPPAWTAREIRRAPEWRAIFYVLSENDAANEAWFEPGDAPDGFPESSGGSARVKTWDGKTAIVEHTGPCILIIRRAFYPGWTFQVDGGAKHAVLKVNCGFQAVPLLGSGTRRVEFHYQPTGLNRGTAVSLAALGGALIVILVSGLQRSGSRSTAA